MRLIIQRVKKAKVKDIKKGVVSGVIDYGLLILLGVKKGDRQESAIKLAEKISKMRIMKDDQDKMNLSIKDVVAEVLVVSQFTLYSDTSGGNRPSFIEAEITDKAKEIYYAFINQLKKMGIKVETGSFGAYMEIEVSLDGPVTILIDG